MCADAKVKMVLVVDDDPGIRESIADFLSDEGYAVLTATDGQDALAKLKATPPQQPCVILLDLMMPNMNGSQFYAAQQNDPALASIPVVVISADGNVRHKSRSFGGEYLAKPVKIDKVLDVVERLCP